MKLKGYQKNILSVIVIAVGGFILFNVAFLLLAFVTNAVMSVLSMSQNEAPHVAGRILYLIIIFLISWVVLRSRLNQVVKATFFTMPLMVVLVLLGLSLYSQPKWLIFGAGAIIISTVFLYLYKKKLPWLYYFAALYDTALALCIMLFNIDI